MLMKNIDDPVMWVYVARFGRYETDSEILSRVRRDKVDIFCRPLALPEVSMTAEEIVRSVVTKYASHGHMISLLRSIGGGQYKRYDKALRPVKFRTTMQPPDGARIFSLDKVAEDVELSLIDANEDNGSVPNLGMTALEDFLRAEDFRSVEAVRKKELDDKILFAVEEFKEQRDSEIKRIAKELASEDTPAERLAAKNFAEDAARCLCGRDVESSIQMIEDKDAALSVAEDALAAKQKELDAMAAELAALKEMIASQPARQKSLHQMPDAGESITIKNTMQVA